MSTTVVFEGLSPLLFGTGKPFGTDPGALSASTHSLPLPSTMAGAIRTALAREAGWTEFRTEYRDLLLGIDIQGPLLVVDGAPYFAPPADAATVEVEGNEMLAPSRPHELPPGSGVDLPQGILPCVIADSRGMTPRKSQGRGFWSQEDTVKWLAKSSDNPISDDASQIDVLRELRVHVELDHDSGAARRGMLFQTEGVCLGDVKYEGNFRRLGIAAKYNAGDMSPISGIATLGGERRLAKCSAAPHAIFECPETIRRAVTGAKRVRLQLATPAVFHQGWRPAWREQAGVGLRLVGGCVSRRIPVSGWNVFGRDGKAGEPKPLSWMAPAGSVYFFEVESGNPGLLADHWLMAVSDDEQSRRDGYGLGLWGIW